MTTSVQYQRPAGAAIAEPLPAGAVLLQVRELRTWFPIKRGVFQRTVGQVKAVGGVSFDVQAGQELGLGGESGCGQTTLGRPNLRLIPVRGRPVRDQGAGLFGLPRAR